MKQILTVLITALALTSYGQGPNIVQGVDNESQGHDNVILGGSANKIMIPVDRPPDQQKADHSVISGGVGNVICSRCSHAWGELNSIGQWSNFSGTGGLRNRIGHGAGYSFCYGSDCLIGDGSAWSTISGGFTNVIDGTTTDGATEDGESLFGTIGGGRHNRVHNTSFYGTIAGGAENRAVETGAFVGGGNKNTARGRYSVVAGGKDNVAHGQFTFAGGWHAHANGDGSFVWNARQPLGNGMTTKPNQTLFVAPGDFRIATGRGNPVMEVTAFGGNGSWSIAASRGDIKQTTLRDVDGAEVLTKIRMLPIRRFNYKASGGVDRIGPYAEEFNALFNIGDTSTHYSTSDALGVCLAAIQQLARVVERQAEDNQALAAVAEEQQSVIDRMRAVIEREHGELPPAQD